MESLEKWRNKRTKLQKWRYFFPAGQDEYFIREMGIRSEARAGVNFPSTCLYSILFRTSECEYRCLYTNGELNFKTGSWVTMKKNVTYYESCDFIEIHCTEENQTTFRYIHVQVRIFDLLSDPTSWNFFLKKQILMHRYYPNKYGPIFLNSFLIVDVLKRNLSCFFTGLHLSFSRKLANSCFVEEEIHK